MSDPNHAQSKGNGHASSQGGPAAQERRVLHEGKWVRLVARGKWEYAERSRGTHACLIVAVTPADEIILIEQWRASVDARVIELPAGLVGDDTAGEHGAEAARRELIEETGFDCQHIEQVAEGTASAGITDERLEMFVARGLTRVSEGGGVEGENIEVHLVPRTQVQAFLAAARERGCVIDLKVWAGLYFAQP